MLNKQKIAVRMTAALLAAGILAGVMAPVAAQAAPAYDSKWTKKITMEELMGEGLAKEETDAAGVYEQLKQGLRFKTITQGSIYYMFLNGAVIPAEAVAMLYQDGLVSGFLYKYMSGLPYVPSDLKDVFNAFEYYCAYPETAAAVPFNENLLMIDFMINGMPQGRIGSTEFNPALYRKNYPELEAILGDNWMNYYIHYIVIGKEKGMTGKKSVR